MIQEFGLAGGCSRNSYWLAGSIAISFQYDDMISVDLMLQRESAGLGEQHILETFSAATFRGGGTEKIFGEPDDGAVRCKENGG